MTTSSQLTIDTLERIRSIARTAPEPLQPILLREVVTGPAAVRAVADALWRLGVPDGSAVAVLTDPTPKSYEGGADVLDVVVAALDARFRPGLVVLAPHTGAVHADAETVRYAVSRVAALDAPCLVTVGSGTLTDIGKVAAHRLGLKHVVVQTAASVNGFADDQSVLLLNGAKRTTPSRWPDSVVIDPGVLAAAPPSMTAAGLGDQLSMFTAGADWYLATATGFDTSYSPTVVEILRKGSAEVMAAAGDLALGSPAAVLALAAALTRGGLAMGLAGRTAPSSGTEHTISHLLEMHAGAHGVAAASHGSQVGAASVVAAAVWERVRARLALGSVTVLPLDEQQLQDRVYGAFGGLDAHGDTAAECWAAYRRKLLWINDNRERLQQLCDTWAQRDRAVGALLATPETIATTLRCAGGASRFAELDPAPDAATATWALTHCHLLRDRFTVVDLAEVIGLWNPVVIAEIVAATQGPPG
ncbi:iron-containing alcohol dehydrogenase [Pseudonocardia sp. GCM10023141]|uniref:iron-containing alcohol dehydrogenase n=1 Tax=Pseudonocardia sp. GCM10023141 TaxID=3252653 RepID=UPI00360715FC